MSAMASCSQGLFFASGEASLFGVWRAPAGESKAVWVICPPALEEEKSARRALTEVAQSLCARGEASLIFAPRGMGDSSGDCAQATLEDWRHDIRAACEEARRRAPQAALCLMGVRLGASLCLQVAHEVEAAHLVLIEPIINGRQAINQLAQRQKLRAMMTAKDANSAPVAAADADDLDGWAVSQAMRAEWSALDLLSDTPHFAGDVQLLQVAPREAIGAPLQKLAEKLNAPAQAVVMQPFWNLLDYAPAEPLIAALRAGGMATEVTPSTTRSRPAPTKALVREGGLRVVEGVTSVAILPTPEPSISPSPETPVSITNARGQNLIGVWHEAHGSRPIILMLHGWSGYRVGPHQMLTRAARVLAQDGHGVLRFDFGGRGDSDGEPLHSTLATMQDDARAALNWIRAQQSSRPMVLLGLCSGCEVALSVAGEADVAGLILWSAPVFAAAESHERAKRKRTAHLKQYARKLLRPETYLKVLSGKLDTQGIRKVVSSGSEGEKKNVESGSVGALPKGWRAQCLAAFKGARRPLLLAYGTADPTTEEALAWHRSHSSVEPQVHQVEGANHSYYSLAWEAEVIETTRQWLARFAASS